MSIPASEATSIFIRETDTDGIAAGAYLPTEYDWCSKCDTREGHSHPGKDLYTEDEIAQAVNEYRTDDFLRRMDA
jgi:hypothetical protein